MSVWSRVPVIGRAVIAGFLVSLFGSVTWSAFLQANLRSPSVPWAVPVMALYLWAFWQYLRGKGWPKSTGESRRRNLRARSVSSDVWRWSLCAGILASAGVLSIRIALGRLIKLPPEQVEDLSRIPFLTVLLLILMTSAVAGLVEEAAFRGYMQGPIERRHGAVTGVLVSATLFGLAHFTGGSWLFLALLPFLFLYGVIYGLLASMTGSILPGVIVHAGQDALIFTLAWRLGPPSQRPLVWEAGGDAHFLVSSSVAIVLVTGSIWTYRRLFLVRSTTTAVEDCIDWGPRLQTRLRIPSSVKEDSR